VTGGAPTVRTVGRYALYQAIASGGMATVYLGRLLGPVGFARTVAVKRLHPYFASDRQFASMFLDEARLAARIRHPNVVPTVDVVATNGELYLVMEYVHGESVARLVRMASEQGKPVPVPVVVATLSGALQGLTAAHEARSERGEPLQIIHRDVSPQNILLGLDGQARLIDFGVARAEGRLHTTQTGQVKGKIAYMSPEQLQGEPIGPSTDVYAASVVLWETLTGQRLFRAENEGNLVALVVEGTTRPPSSVVPELPEALDALVLRGLSVNPADRFATARDMASELAACMPVAPPEEVGEWVEAHAAQELSERAARIADIERDSAVSQSRELRSSPGSANAAPTSTPTGRREANPPSLGATRVRPVEVSSGVSSVAVAHPTAPPGPPVARRNGTWIGLATVSFLGLCALLMFVRMTTRSAATDSPPSEPVQPPSAEPAAPLAQSAAPPPPSAPQPVAPSTATVAEPSARPGAAKTNPHPGGPATHTSTKPDCNPPYTTDDHGHVHFKPACL